MTEEKSPKKDLKRGGKAIHCRIPSKYKKKRALRRKEVSRSISQKSQGDAVGGTKGFNGISKIKVEGKRCQYHEIRMRHHRARAESDRTRSMVKIPWPGRVRRGKHQVGWLTLLRQPETYQERGIARRGACANREERKCT